MRYRLKAGFGMKDIQTKENLIHITEKEFIELPDEVAEHFHEWLEADSPIVKIKPIETAVPEPKAAPKNKSASVKKAVPKSKKR